MMSTVLGWSADRDINGQSITLDVSGSGTLSYYIEEQLPSGCTASSVSDGGNFNSGSRKVIWNFQDNNDRDLTYTVSCSSGSISGQIYGGDPPSMKQIGSETQITSSPSLYCGDGSCNNGETCSSCSQDCGTCQTGSWNAVRDINGQSITLDVSGTGTLSYYIEENLPSGCSASSVSNGGSYNSVSGKVIWNFQDNNDRDLTYTVSCSSGTLSGEMYGGDNPVSMKIIGGETEIVSSTPDCGNGDIDTSEDCDGTNLNSKTLCSQYNSIYDSGSLSCTSLCLYDLTGCSTTTPECSAASDCVDDEKCVSGVCVEDSEDDDDVEDFFKDNKLLIILGATGFIMLMLLK